ncbi:hypothetical protein OG594_45480 [Streptomyces sp. NBC_01214]|nr:hypothetical protein [Streptomyces sp. NBC_01214]
MSEGAGAERETTGIRYEYQCQTRLVASKTRVRTGEQLLAVELADLSVADAAAVGRVDLPEADVVRLRGRDHLDRDGGVD